MQINVLGTKYKLIIDGTVDEYPDLDGSDGYCNYQSKEIVLSSEEHDGTISYDRYMQKVLRHEIIHAYLYESGLHDYTNDELIVDWIAIQFPKINKIFDKLEI